MNYLHRNEGKSAYWGRIAAIEGTLETGGRLKQQSPWCLCFCAFLLCVVGLATFLGMAGCSTGAAKPESSQTPLISVAITQAPPTSLIVGSSAQVSASVNDDIANAGVDWVASCGSAPNCGSFSPSHTASGATTVFTAPLAVPAKNIVAVTALSTTDHSKAFSANVTIISTVTGVTITQALPASVPAGTNITLAATVAGDPANEGVDWTATCTTALGTANCTPPGLHSAAGGSTTFTVPGLIGSPSVTVNSVTITAFATADHNYSAFTSFTVTTAISINITQVPPSTMLTNAAATVIAVVSNDTTNSGVTWSVSCGGNPCGSISPTQTASGAAAIFTAPPTPPPPGIRTPNGGVIITASATATGAQVSASLNVTIVAPISVTITQGVPTGSMIANSGAPLVATVANDTADAGVDWTVSCGGPGACGTFSPAHTASGAATTFTAPASVPAGNTVTITAASTTDPTKTADETVTITASVPPNSLLLGQFVMLLTAKNSVNGPFAVGGIISGDGTGNITSASFDLSDASGNGSTTVNVSSTSASTYSIGPDGRGQIKLVIDVGALNGPFGVNGSGAITLSVAFVTPQHALLSEIDSFGNGTGTLDLQNLDWSGLGGAYLLRLSGFEVSRPTASYFVASAVTIPSGSSYSYVTDQSDNGVVTSVPFATVSSDFQNAAFYPNGELGLSSINLGLPTKFNLDLWLVDATHFVVTDWRDSFAGTPPVIIAGYFTAQPSSPSLSGTYAFTEAGATTSAQPQVAGGILTCGSTGTLDVVPLAGTGLANQPINATCAAPANGRGLITISGAATAGISQFAAYPTSDQGVYLIELDGGAAGTSGPSGAGVALQQTLSTPISDSAFSGQYASNFVANTALGSEIFAAQIVSDGVSGISGAADVNSFNATATPRAGSSSSGAVLSGSFTTSADGRFPLTLTVEPATGQPTPEITTLHPACYIVDANTCLLLGLDATAPGTGMLLLQNTGL